MIIGAALPTAALERVTVADPAVSTDFVYVLPDGYQYQLYAVLYRLATDANAANRFGAIELTMQGRGCKIIPAFAHVANTTWNYRFYVGIDGLGAITDGDYAFTRLPYPFVMQSTDTIASDVRNMQAGDQVSSIDLFLYRVRIQGV